MQKQIRWFLTFISNNSVNPMRGLLGFGKQEQTKDDGEKLSFGAWILLQQARYEISTDWWRLT